MLKNDKVNLVIALLIAIGLWGYVMIVENPVDDRAIKNVPIAFVHEDLLEDSGLVRISTSDSTVTATVEGHLTSLSDVDKNDIRVVADLEGLQAGEHTIQLRVTGKPDDVDVELNKRKITVVIDRVVTREKNITAYVSGNQSDEREPYIIELEKTAVDVTGAESLVEKVKTISAVLDVKLVGDELRAINVDLLPVDADGNTVEGVTLKEKSISITAVMLNKKTVPLDVPVIGMESETGGIRTVNVPKTITVKGYASSLRSISSITAEPLDVSRIFEDATLPVVPLLPQGIEVASNSQNLQARVEVEGLQSRSFTYGEEAIILEGMDEGVHAQLADTAVILTVIGRELDVELLTEADFYFIANVSGLEAGTHQVELFCQHEKNISELSFTPKEVTVTISGAGGTEESPGSESGGGAQQDELTGTE